MKYCSDTVLVFSTRVYCVQESRIIQAKLEVVILVDSKSGAPKKQTDLHKRFIQTYVAHVISSRRPFAVYWPKNTVDSSRRILTRDKRGDVSLRLEYRGKTKTGHRWWTGFGILFD